jgi:hypothetical protein
MPQRVEVQNLPSRILDFQEVALLSRVPFLSAIGIGQPNRSSRLKVSPDHIHHPPSFRKSE